MKVRPPPSFHEATPTPGSRVNILNIIYNYIRTRKLLNATVMRSEKNEMLGRIDGEFKPVMIIQNQSDRL